MKPILSDLEQVLQESLAVAYATLVETRGSTPQKAGAAMLVFPNGSQAGTLGGGCVEADVKRQALKLLNGGEPQILTFQLDSDYGWDDGLICGGRMKMLVDPILPGIDTAYFQKVVEQYHSGAGFTEAIVVDSDAQNGQAGERYLFNAEGNLVAFRGQDSVARAIREQLKPIRSRPRPYFERGVSYLPFLQRCRLIIVGGGHVGLKVAELASEVDFDIWVVDDREEYCHSERFPQAQKLIVGSFDKVLQELDVDHNTLCLIVTRGHNHDEEALSHLAQTDASYVGLIGSRRKIKLIFEDLLRAGISRESLERVYAPIGFDIGSQTVPEIAVSVVAELVAHRNLGHIPDHFRSKNPLSNP